MEEVWKTFKERKEDYGVVVTQVQIRKPLLMFARFVDDQFEQIGIDSCNAFWWKTKGQNTQFHFLGFLVEAEKGGDKTGLNNDRANSQNPNEQSGTTPKEEK